MPGTTMRQPSSFITLNEAVTWLAFGERRTRIEEYGPRVADQRKLVQLFDQSVYQAQTSTEYQEFPTCLPYNPRSALIDSLELCRPSCPSRRRRQYRLKGVAGEGQVSLKGGFVCVTVERYAGPDRIRELVMAWYRCRARLKLREGFDSTWPKFHRFIATGPELLLRPMKMRWGSHTPAGRIILNHDLVRAPSPCIDYVVAHELAHVVHRNHSAAFLRLLDTVLPDWRSRKERLERLLA